MSYGDDYYHESDREIEYVDIEVLLLIHATNQEYLVEDEDGDEYWIPKSQVQDIVFGESKTDSSGRPVKEIKTLTIPKWLAEDKGLN